MKMIGKYQGIKCYECSKKEWELERDLAHIFIINGDMVYKNRLMGRYDGHRVEIYDEPHKMYGVAEFKPVVSNVKKEFDFKQYTKIVDDFFKELERSKGK